MVISKQERMAAALAPILAGRPEDAALVGGQVLTIYKEMNGNERAELFVNLLMSMAALRRQVRDLETRANRS